MPVTSTTITLWSLWRTVTWTLSGLWLCLSRLLSVTWQTWSHRWPSLSEIISTQFSSSNLAFVRSASKSSSTPAILLLIWGRTPKRLAHISPSSQLPHYLFGHLDMPFQRVLSGPGHSNQPSLSLSAFAREKVCS